MDVRRLARSDDRSTFESGDVEIDRFFRRYAAQNQFEHHVGVTYVATERADILGFVTIAGGSTEIDALPASFRKKLPRYPLPVLRLARLGVDRRFQNRGVAGALLHFTFQMAITAAGETGCIGVLVDAKPGAVSVYEHYGFVPLAMTVGQSETRPVPHPMFLPISTLVLAGRRAK
jgi:GNAT superfamily N-acetyltransferase